MCFILKELREEEEDINEIEKMMKREKQRQEINARYYQRHRNYILLHNAMKVRCKLCDVVIKVFSYWESNRIFARIF